MRTGIIALLHESNTFIAEPTTFERFEQDLLVEGEAVRAKLARSHHEVGGFFEGLEREGIEAVPIFAARAMPYGTIAASAFDPLWERLERALSQAGPLDGVLLAPHGAAVAENASDADGEWLSRVRERLGAAVPMIATLDLHANLSQRMVEACDAIIAYRGNPHLDQRARGIEAAALMARTLRGEVRPTMAAAFPPMAVNIERQLTSQPPCRPLYDLADAMRTRPGVLSNSLVLGFPYADVAEMGSSVIVVTDRDRDAAQRAADELAAAWWAMREEFVGRLIAPESAIADAKSEPGPTCLLDMGDNVGGGSPGDGTILARMLFEGGIGPAFVCLYDPESVEQARAAGTGSVVALRIGGKTDDRHGSPIEAEFEVLGLYDGKFEETEPRHGGMVAMNQGPTAVVRAIGAPLVAMLTSRRMAPFSLRQLTTFGVDPAEFRVLVAKGVHAPVAAYAPVCRQLIRVDTPGVTTANMERLTYHHRRRPMFPFERGDDV